jgi:DNA segregation ATPase FtsK/SpoIIIE, S-DNA-T family
MPKKPNQFKTNSLKKEKTVKKKKTKKNSGQSFFSFFKSPKFLKITGFFFIVLSIYLLIGFISYFFTWWKDFDKISSLSFGEVTGNVEIYNWTGYLGAYISNFFIKELFGASSIFFVLLFFISGVKLLTKIAIFPVGKSFRYSFLGIIWFSVAFSFIFSSPKYSILGGMFGYQSNLFLHQFIGNIGIGFLLFFILISFLIIAFNFSLNFKFKKKEKDDDEESISKTNREKTDRYNTAEYSISEEESISDLNENEDKNELNNNSDFEDINLGIEKKTNNNNNNENNDDTSIELTIENPQPEEEKKENKKNIIEHQTLDTEYDPTLDLADYQYPTLELLDDYDSGEISVQKEELESNKDRIVETLLNYSIKIDKIRATIGPTVTLYEIIPAPGIRISKIKNLEDDIALSLAAMGIRIIAPIPGKGTIGIEVPNRKPEIVSIKSILSSRKFMETKYELPFGLGKTIANESFVADLTKMPHILMAGATGQGKSVGLNAIITSLLYKKHPAQLKFVLIDPKKVELTLFTRIERHFLAQLPDAEEAIVNDTRVVVRTLNSLGIEMDNRYDLLKDAQVRNIKEYNTKFIARKLNPEHGHRFLPYIVLVIDEFADLIMMAGKEVEIPIARLAQLARAIGIHLIIATQRPSVNIITGTIKANFPARIAFRVISKIDSRTILDSGGADQLIGRGDMLLSTGSDLVRLQCAYVDTPEIEKITDFIGQQRAYPLPFYLPDCPDEESIANADFDPNERDELFEDAARIIVLNQQGSTSLLQRKLKLGYNRAGRIIDQLEAAGIVGPFEGSKAREVRVANEFALDQFLKDL